MPPCIVEHLDEIRALCERYGIRRLDLFGSATTSRFDEQSSDLDFVVDFADRSPGYADRYLAVADGLEALFGRPVDLVTERSIQDPSFRRTSRPAERRYMTEETARRLRDVLTACRAIELFVSDMNFETYAGLLSEPGGPLR